MITHFGCVKFTAGDYTTLTGSDNWIAEPIEGFDPPIKLPLGQVRIRFDSPIPHPYGVLVTAHRQPHTPLLAANYGDATADGFIVHLWETTADRTIQNGDFSFLVLSSEQLSRSSKNHTRQ